LIVGSGHFFEGAIKPLRSIFWKSNHYSQFLGNHLTIEVIFGKPSNHCGHFLVIIKPLWSFFWKSNHCGQFLEEPLNHCGHFLRNQTIMVIFLEIKPLWSIFWETIKPLWSFFGKPLNHFGFNNFSMLVNFTLINNNCHLIFFCYCE
jgi:hypothetical protein